MADCRKYRDMISGFADGELSDKEKTEVQKHLETCETCRALLSVYREVSGASEASMAPPPDGFAGSVMDRIKALPADAAPFENTTPKKPKKPVIISFIAAAACLALVFIAVPQLFNLSGSSRTASMPSAAAAPAASAAPSSHDAYGSSTGGGGAPGVSKKAADTGSAENAQSYAASSGPQVAAGTTSADDNAGQSAEPKAAPDDAPNAAPGAAPGAAPNPTPNLAPGHTQTTQNISQANASNLQKYFAVINVTGPLPELLKNDVQTSNSDGTYNIEVPVQTAEQLIGSYAAVMGNKDAATALVVYTPA